MGKKMIYYHGAVERPSFCPDHSSFIIHYSLFIIHYSFIIQRGVAQFGRALRSGANHRFPFCDFRERQEPLKILTILVVANLIIIPM